MLGEDFNKSRKNFVVKTSTTREFTSDEQTQQDINVSGKPELAQAIAGVDDDDLEYILDKVDSFSFDEVLEMMAGILRDHKDDINFEATTYARLENLLEGPQAVSLSLDDYEYEVKTLTGVCKFFSPYPEVRSVTKPYDDPTIPVETARAYFLGFMWSVLGQFVNCLFYSRFPSIALSSPVCQTLIYPCGKFFETVLPDWGITFGGVRHSLNPGPWSYKEQMFSTIIFNIALANVYVFANIQTQELYYKDEWLTPTYKILLILSTQCLGFGFVGVLRRFVIYPTECYWPTLLPTIALNRALLAPEKKEVINGWSISRYKFFFIVFTAMFIYYWIPAYLFEAIGYFSWMTWIAPENFNLAAVSGTQFGLGFNPLPTFDWNIIRTSSPLVIPFYNTMTNYCGAFLSGLCILAMYYTNNSSTAYLPINSSNIFTNTGKSYDVTKVITNGVLDVEKYKRYSPPFYSAANLLYYGAFFAAYPVVFLYVLLDQWKLIRKAGMQAYEAFASKWKQMAHHAQKSFKTLLEGKFRQSFTELTNIFHDDNSIYDGYDDPFTQMISRYPEVPDWWFWAILLVSLIFGLIILGVYTELNTPKWTLFFVIAISFVFLIPMEVIRATTGSTIGLSVVIELIIGYALPGNGEALMLLKAYGYNIDGQASSYISDQKNGHYAQIPPRAQFRGQFIATIIASFVGFAVVDWVDNNIRGICTPEAQSHFNCARGSQVYYSAAVLWGNIGPKRVFSQQYPILKWMFLFGFLLAVTWWSVKNYGPVARSWMRNNLSPIFFKPMNLVVFTPLSWLHEVHPFLIINGFLLWAPTNLSYYTVGLYFSIYFMHYLRRYKTAWWEKYNYVLSAGLDAGLAFSGTILFFAVQYHEKDISWWGNNIITKGIDGGGSKRTSLYTELPEKGYFGPDEWH
ncbi:unnamed protein product [Ambrosiozyma monospora]|uniref:Unnamed protein product n=1 Tax=Ambrosiozyma monospora TaxID=43982 RepID=A0A9W6YWR4_AMBMO|nr:unnamed protein product [Ambrosiozyma monospora]